MDAKPPEILVAVLMDPEEGRHLLKTLADGDIASVACDSAAGICDRLRSGLGAVVACANKLGEADASALRQCLADQPDWSDVPFIILSQDASCDCHNHYADLLGNVRLLQRPVDKGMLVSAVRAALRSRQLQYEHRRTFEEHAGLGADRSRLADILEATCDCVVTADNDGKVLYVNGACKRMLGLDEEASPDELTLEKLHPTWAWQMLRDETLPAVRRDGIWSGGSAILTLDGKEIAVSQVAIGHVSARPLSRRRFQ